MDQEHPTTNNEKSLPETEGLDESIGADEAAADATQSDEDDDAIEVIAAEQAPSLEELQRAVVAADDRALRSQAELENFRKRMFRQLDDERKYAPMPVLRDMLAVVDNLDRAIAAAEQNHDAEALFEGVKLVAQQLNTVLQQHHCSPIEAKGQAFDPHVHEAVSHMPSNDHAEGTVIDVAQTGYRLHDRVIRPTQVLVSAGPATDAAAEQQEPPEE